MNFSKCGRCGCFFAEGNGLCPNCEPKDKNEMSLLKNYLLDTTIENQTVETISASTGISEKNITRFLTQKDFNQFSNQIQRNSFTVEF